MLEVIDYDFTDNKAIFMVPYNEKLEIFVETGIEYDVVTDIMRDGSERDRMVAYTVDVKAIYVDRNGEQVGDPIKLNQDQLDRINIVIDDIYQQL